MRKTQKLRRLFSGAASAMMRAEKIAPPQTVRELPFSEGFGLFLTNFKAM